jgi:curved DNA-binding protein CbpA
MGDYYALLGVDAAASTAEIHAAFRRAANTAHPDHHNGRSPGDVVDSARRMSELNEAWWTLRDVNRRAAYDNARRPPTRTLLATPRTDADVATSTAPHRGVRPTLVIATALLVVVVLGLFLIAMAQSGSYSGH